MSSITALVLAAFVGYGGAWYMGAVDGNFSLLLFLATVVTGIYWLAERFYFLPQRRQAVQVLEQASAKRNAELVKLGVHAVQPDVVEARARLMMQPWWLDWTAGLFPVIIVVFILRSFLFEPFKIPSGSMIPTLLVGDLILVNKFHYGVRLPVINQKIIPFHDPQRGDVMVFRYPKDPRIDYIKRVVGVPGDEVAYRHQQLYLNGVLAPTQALPDFYNEDSLRYSAQFTEDLGTLKHQILVDRSREMFLRQIAPFPFSENCVYNAEGITCKVPPGHYFMMGDNRDNSEDSRFWGFVPDANIVGKAFFVWMNFGNVKRIGAFQ